MTQLMITQFKIGQIIEASYEFDARYIFFAEVIYVYPNAVVCLVPLNLGVPLKNSLVIQQLRLLPQLSLTKQYQHNCLVLYLKEIHKILDEMFW